MEKYFENKLNITCKTNKTKYVLINSLIKKSLDRKSIRNKYVLITGVIGFGLNTGIATVHYPLNLLRIFFDITWYSFSGLLVGLSSFKFIESSITKYSKNINEQFN